MAGRSAARSQPMSVFLAVTACLLMLVLAASGWAEQQIGALRGQLAEASRITGQNAVRGSRPSNPHLGEHDASLWISTGKEEDRMARFQQVVSDLLETHKAELVELRSAPSQTGDHPTRLRLSLQLQIAPNRLQAMLLALESREPLILIDLFELSTAEHQGTANSNSRPGLLNLKIDVSAFAPAAHPV